MRVKIIKVDDHSVWWDSVDESNRVIEDHQSFYNRRGRDYFEVFNKAKRI